MGLNCVCLCCLSRNSRWGLIVCVCVVHTEMADEAYLCVRVVHSEVAGGAIFVCLCCSNSVMFFCLFFPAHPWMCVSLYICGEVEVGRAYNSNLSVCRKTSIIISH